MFINKNLRNLLLIIVAVIVGAVAFFKLSTMYKSGPVIVTAPESKPSNFETDDPSYLKIKIENKNYGISFMNKNLSLNNTDSLDAFMQKNKAQINTDKVLVTGFDAEKHKALYDVLKKNGIFKFRVNTL